MRREHERHPILEFLVFGLAFVLLAVLLFYGGRAFMNYRASQQAQTGPAPGQDVTAEPAKPQAKLEHDLDVGPTERGVNVLPPVKVTRMPKSARKSLERSVPAPK